MRARMFVFVIPLMLSLFVLLTGQSPKEGITVDDVKDVLAGRWLNSDYNSEWDTSEFIMAKEIITYSSVLYYESISLWEPSHIGELSINEVWLDENWDIWIKAQVKLRRNISSKYPFKDLFILYKINENGMAMREMISFSFEHYEEIDPNSENYRIYFRLNGFK